MNKNDGRVKVLFVCIGNACRSPMAEAIARIDSPDAIEAFSAGLAPIGFVPWLTKLTLRRNVYWVEGLQPKSISPELWEQADIVINMSGRPRQQAFREYSKVEDWEIEDPFDGDLDTYQQVFEKIRLRVAQLSQECRQKIAAARSAERRARARLSPTSPIFVNVNGANGGIGFNISEDGLALSSAMILPDGPLRNMQIQFPGSQAWIEVSGQIAWKGKSNKEAGVRFDSLTEEACLQIRSWISSQTPAVEMREQTDVICKDRNLRMEIPNVRQPEYMIPRTSTSVEVMEEGGEAPLFSPAGTPTLHGLGQPDTAPSTYAQPKKRTDKKAVQSRPKIALEPRHPGVPRPRWGTFAFAAMGFLIGFISLSLEWMTMRRDVVSETRAAVTQEAGVSAESAQRATLPPVSTIPSSVNPSEEKADLQSRSVESLLAEERESIPKTSLENPDRRVRAAERPSANPILKTPGPPVKIVLARAKVTEEPPRAATTVNKLPLEKVQQLPVGRLPATSTLLEAKAAPPVIPAPNLPADAAPVDLKKIEMPLPPAKQPAIPANITGAVATLADPYPSLRIPEGGVSKKQRQATSLQLGHLLSRVEPIYPEEAKQKGIQGTVKLHAIIGRQGAVENLESVDGSPVLVAAAMNAVRQWRYTETRLAGQSVETEEDIAVTFQLSNPKPPTN
jgi:TonB family protein